jgi:hypothetical protein
MVKEGVTVFVEGGGDSDALKTECRRAFRKLVERAGFKNTMPKFVACGTRRNAFDKFNTACGAGERGNLLLVDSEAAVTAGSSPWEHVRRRQGDGWAKPPAATDDDLHFMVECMEAWLFDYPAGRPDQGALAAYYGADLKKNALPARADVENLSKADLYNILRNAAGKRGYGKGNDSFKILEKVDPGELRRKCPGADRFFAEIARRLL